MMLIVLAAASMNAWCQVFDETFEPPLDTLKATPAPAPAVDVPRVTPVDLGRHHIHLGILGLFRAANSSLKLTEMDARWASAADACYRYSFNPRWDLAVDLHGWGYVNQRADQDQYALNGTAGGLGLGCRYNFRTGSKDIFPYIQANVYSIAVDIKTSSDHYPHLWEREGSGWGVGANGGFELRLGKRISIPLEIYLLAANPITNYTGYEMILNQYGQYVPVNIRRTERFNMSGVGFTAGLTLNLGSIEKEHVTALQVVLPSTPATASAAIPVVPLIQTGAETAAKGTPEAVASMEPITPMPFVPEAAPRKRRHHISAGLLGYAHLDYESFGKYGEGARSATCNTVNYRYTVIEPLDLMAEGVRWSNNLEYNTVPSGQVRIAVDVKAVGLGLRAKAPEPSWPVQPYVQISAVGITEDLDLELGGHYNHRSTHGYGAVFGGGIEIKVADQAKIPIYVFHLSGKPDDYVGTTGITTGISLSW